MKDVGLVNGPSGPERDQQLTAQCALGTEMITCRVTTMLHVCTLCLCKYVCVSVCLKARVFK